MPIFSEQEILDHTVSRETPIPSPVPAPEKTGFLEASRAFFALENPVFNATRELFAPDVSNEIDPNFSVEDTLATVRPELLPFAENFNDVVNEEQFIRTAFNIDYELGQREKFAKAPTLTKLAAGLAASLTDPLVLIPIAGAVSKGAKIAQIGRGALTGVGLAGTAAVAREGILQATQETRTATESGINIIAEAALGGILGAAAGALSKPLKGAAKGLYENALEGKDVKINSDTLKIDPRSVGAAETKSELDKLGLARLNSTVAKIATGPEFLRPPDLRAILSPSETIRKFGETLYNSTYIRKKNIEGEANLPNAQNMIFQRDQVTHQINKNIEEGYLKYAQTTRVQAAVPGLRPKGKITLDQFNTRIWRSLVNKQSDNITQINVAAKELRGSLKAYAKELQELELISKDIDPEFLETYITRIYDVDKLADPTNRKGFVDTVGQWLQTHKANGKVREEPLSKEDAQILADDFADKVLGESEAQIPLSGIAEDTIKRESFTKGRQLFIPDQLIEDFVVTDASRLFKNYASRANRLIETTKALQRAGHKDFKNVISSIRNDAKKVVKQEKGKSREKLIQKFKNEEELASNMYRSLLGQLRKPGKSDRYTQTLLNYQFTRLLGGVTVSSLPEIWMPAFRHGIIATLRDGYLPMIRSVKTSKMTKDQLNDLSGALEFEQNNLLRALGGIDDIANYGRNQNTFDKASEALVGVFAKATGITAHTSMQRRISSQISSAQIMRSLLRGPKGKEIQELATLGIGKKDYARLNRQIKKYSQEYEGSFVPNPHMWKDQEALKLFRNAVQIDVESTILKPGVEALPFFVQKNQWAKVIFQFKSFMSAATGRMTLSGLQRGDVRALTGIMGLIGLGAVTDMLKDTIAGRDLQTSPEQLFINGMSRSGILGLLGTAVLDTGISFTNEKTRRFGAKYVASNILGPSAGQIEELVKTVQGLTDGEITERDMKKLQRMIPFMNLFYIKALTERAFGDK